MMRFLNLLLVLYIAEEARAGESGCPDPFILLGDQCLLFVPDEFVNYQDAQDLCHAYSAELAKITTADQFALVVEHILDIGYGTPENWSFWVDGTDLEQEGIWVTSSGELVPRGTPFWASYYEGVQQPDNYYNKEHCLSIFTGMFNYLNDLPCGNVEHYICEVPLQRAVNNTSTASGATPTSNEGMSATFNHQATNQTAEGKAGCPSSHVEVGGRCLLFMTYTKVSWSEAGYLCADSDKRLAITDANLMRELYLYLHREGFSEYSFWLDGSDIDKEGQWVYTTGQPVPMGTPFWGLDGGANNQEPIGETRENCLLLDHKAHHYFNDIHCSFEAYPLCVYIG